LDCSGNLFTWETKDPGVIAKTEHGDLTDICVGAESGLARDRSSKLYTWKFGTIELIAKKQASQIYCSSDSVITITNPAQTYLASNTKKSGDLRSSRTNLVRRMNVESYTASAHPLPSSATMAAKYLHHGSFAVN